MANKGSDEGRLISPRMGPLDLLDGEMLLDMLFNYCFCFLQPKGPGQTSVGRRSPWLNGIVDVLW